MPSVIRRVTVNNTPIKAAVFALCFLSLLVLHLFEKRLRRLFKVGVDLTSFLFDLILDFLLIYCNSLKLLDFWFIWVLTV